MLLDSLVTFSLGMVLSIALIEIDQGNFGRFLIRSGCKLSCAAHMGIGIA